MTVTTSRAIAAPAARIQSRTCVRLLIAAMRRDMHAERQWCCQTKAVGQALSPARRSVSPSQKGTLSDFRTLDSFVGQLGKLRRVGNPPCTWPAPVNNRRAGCHPAPPGLDLILAELAIERVAGDAEYPGGLGAIAAGYAQRLLDGEPLHLLHGERVAEVKRPGPVGLAAHQHGFEILIGDGLRVVRGNRGDALQQVLQLAHVPRES